MFIQKRCCSNLNLTKGLIFSQGVMLELTKKGFSRERSYKVVQKHSANARNKKYFSTRQSKE